MLILLLSLLALQANSAEIMKNIEFLASGYDIYKGNPHSTQGGIDPGFAATIFKFDFSSGHVTGDQRWEIPDNMDFRPDYGCDLSFSTQEVTGTQSYVKSLEAGIEAGAEGYGQKFSASSDFKRVKNSTHSQHYIYTTSKAVCSVYDGRLNAIVLPEPDYMFAKTIEALPTTYDDEIYQQFLTYYGTHYITQVKMGAKYGFQSSFRQEDWSDMQDVGLNIEMSASLSGYGVSGSAKVLTKEQQNMVKTFNSKKSSTYQYSLGSKPPSDGKAESWAQEAITEPMPIWYRVDPISSLFKSSFLPNAKNLSTLKSNVNKAISKYCDYLKGRGLVETCSPPGPDPLPPAKANSCRFCYSSCGNGYTQDGGTLVVPPSHTDYMKSYQQQCIDHTYARNGHDHLKLCCQPEKSQVTHGGCRLCTGCGGEYNTYSGSYLNDWTRSSFYQYIYDDTCSGAAQQRSRTKSAYYFCCKPNPVCAFCSTCGGNWPNEVGSMTWNYQSVSREYDVGCSGSIGQHQFDIEHHGGVKMCCKGKPDMYEEQEIRGFLSKNNTSWFM